MEVIELIEEMRNICETLRKEGKRIRLVPTMGALHPGHASLIRSAFEDQLYDDNCWRQEKEVPEQHDEERGVLSSDPNHLAANTAKLHASLERNHNETSNSASCARVPGKQDAISRGVVVIVSIFLNPKQFNNPADYVNYPNTRATDLELCKLLNVRYVFAPTLKQLYPACCQSSGTNRLMASAVASQNNTQCMVAPPDRIANDLEGGSRPGHFKGMLSVVSKLFNIIRPHEAYFGEKDYQQLILVTQMSRDLNQDVNIRPVATIRDNDMLPLSSRNVRLSESQRQVAPLMYKVLMDAKQALEELDSAIDDPGHGANNKCSKIGSVLTASMLTTVCLNTDEYNAQQLDIDYLELRCARDVSRISYEQDSNRFDCELSCSKRQLEKGHNITLKTRLLISVVVGKVRLLDNVEVLLNHNRALR